MDMGKAAGINSCGAGCREYILGEWHPGLGVLPEENALTIFVNGQEIVTIMCTPEKLNCLVAGFLCSEGFIRGLKDIETMRICPDESVADIRLKAKEIPLPKKRILNSGCGGGQSFELGEGLEPVRSSFSASPEQVLSSVQKLLRENADPGQNGRRKGMHRSALSDGEKIFVVAEDIGRHNTIDKVWGECILRKIPTAGRILVTTGRISSDMLIKAVKMGVPVVASLNSATRRAVELGVRLGVTVVGYARGSRCSVFCDEKRLETTPLLENH